MKKICSIIFISFMFLFISGCYEETYTVTFIANDSIFETITVKKGEKVYNIEAPSIVKKEFMYWSLDEVEFDFNTLIEGDITLIAKYKDLTYTVTYIVPDFIEYEEIVYPFKKAPELVPDVPSGSKFLYWEYQGEEWDFGALIICDITLTAKLESTTESITDPIIIEYWHANGAALTEELEEIKDEFEAKYEGKYTVKLTSYGDYDTLRDTITSAIAAGMTPTAAQTYPDHVSLFLEGAALQSLDTYINDAEYGMSIEEQAEFIEGFWAEGTIYDTAGTRYAMPFNKSTELMYYNKTIFDKYGWTVPTTWDEVVEIAKLWMATPEYAAAKTTNKGKVYALGYDSEDNMFITLTQQWGAKYTSFDINGKGQFNAFGAVESDVLKSKEAMNWYLTNFNNGYVATSTGFSAKYCSDAFFNGQCIMLIGSSSQAIYNDGDDYGFETGVSSVPQKDKTNSQVIQKGTNVSLFKCTNKEEELGGWLWLKHMVSYESVLKWSLDTVYYPIRKDVINSTEYQNHILGKIVADDGSTIDGIQTLQLKAKQAELLQQDWFFTNSVFPGSSRTNDYAETIVQQILYGSVSIDKAYEWAYNSVLNY